MGFAAWTSSMRFVRAAAWIVLVVGGSVAAAGLVLSLDHPPTDAARPELTARDAAILARRLNGIDPVLQDLSVAAQQLAGSGRDVLVGLRALDLPAATTAFATGDTALDDLTVAAASARALEPGLLDGLGSGERLPAADRGRVAAIAAALAGVDALADAWAATRRAALAPTALLTALHRHDEAVDRASGLGRAARYREAVAVLQVEAAAALADAVAVRDDAQDAGRDVSMLDNRLARVTDHDAALLALYQQLDEDGGVRTPEVDAALAALTVTGDGLTATKDDVASAIGELGAGDITPALLTIDEIRGAIETAGRPTASVATWVAPRRRGRG